MSGMVRKEELTISVKGSLSSKVCSGINFDNMFNPYLNNFNYLNTC
jgi:hypothetical protein